MDFEVVYSSILLYEYADVEYFLEIPNDRDAALLKIIVWSNNERHYYNLNPTLQNPNNAYPFLNLNERKIPSFGMANLTVNQQSSITLNIIAHLLRDKQKTIKERKEQ